MQELECVREKLQNKYRVVKTDEDLEWNRAIDLCTNIINAHLSRENDPEIARSSRDNDGWISVEERMPTQEECEDNWFWIAYGDSFRNSPSVARCEWVFADDENGNDDSGSEFYIDQFPLPYKPSKNLIKAWKIIDIPAPYRPERNGT